MYAIAGNTTGSPGQLLKTFITSSAPQIAVFSQLISSFVLGMYEIRIRLQLGELVSCVCYYQPWIFKLSKEGGKQPSRARVRFPIVYDVFLLSCGRRVLI